MWPDTPLKTFLQGSTPGLDADDLNDFQKAINQLWGHSAGTSHYLFTEDFDERLLVDLVAGALVTTSVNDLLVGKFSALLGLGAANGKVTLKNVAGTPDAGVYGAVALGGDADAAALTVLRACPLSLGTRDYAVSFKAQINDKSKLHTVGSEGFKIGDDNDSVVFFAGNDEANWIAQVDGGSGQDLGIAVADDTWYKLQAIRAAGTIKLYINGTQVYSVASSSDISSFVPVIQAKSNAGPGAGSFEYAYADYFKLLSVRL